MTNLPSLYARVVAKRPELAVNADDGPWTLAHDGADWDWQCHSIDDVLWRCEEMTEKTASALILARLVEGLPQGYFIAKTCSGFDVAVIDNYACVHWSDRPAFDHPVDALAAFYLGETT